MSPGDWKPGVPGHLQSQAIRPGMKLWGLSLRPARRLRQGAGSACSAGAWAVGRGMVGPPTLLSDLLPRLLPRMCGDPGPLPGASNAVRHILSTFPQAFRNVIPTPSTHTLCVWGGGLQGLGLLFICLVPFQTDVSFYFGLPEKQAVSFPLCPWGGLLGRRTRNECGTLGSREDSDLRPDDGP